MSNHGDSVNSKENDADLDSLLESIGSDNVYSEVDFGYHSSIVIL